MAKQTVAATAMSTRTASAVEGGGTEGAVATITEAQYVGEFSYASGQEGGAAIFVVYDIPGFKKPWEQNYSLGKSAAYTVLDNGDRIVGKLNKNSNGFRLLSAIETAASEAGILDDVLPEDGSIAELRGRTVVLTNVKYTTVGGDEKELVVPAKFVEGATSAKGSAKSAKNGSGDVEGELEGIIVGLLQTNPTIKKADLSKLVFDAARKNPGIKAMSQLCYKEAWYGSDDRPWNFDNKKGTLKAS